METTEAKTQTGTDEWQRWEKQHARGKVMWGVVLVVVGGLFLAREIGIDFPHWLLSWKMLLIAIGVASGIKHGFRKMGWMIPILIGSIFLLNDFYPGLVHTDYLWPIVLIVVGLFIIFKPRNRNHAMFRERWHRRRSERQQGFSGFTHMEGEVSSENAIDVVAVFGGVKKNIVAKDFKQGDITIVMAGAQINFSQADIVEKATLDITAFFGGAKLVVPANWEIVSEVTAIFGSVEDKRNMVNAGEVANKKVLVLSGTVFFGGIDIRNY